MELDLTPKKYRRKPSRNKGRKTPRIIKNWHNPFQLMIAAVALVAFVGSVVTDQIKSRHLYSEKFSEARQLAEQADAQNALASETYTELQRLLNGVVLKEKSEQELALDTRLDETDNRLTERFMQVNACYDELPYKYRSSYEARKWFVDFASRCIQSALDRKNYDLAVNWFNASSVKEFMPDTRKAAEGKGSLELSAGTNIDEVVVFALKSDGSRLVPCDPVAKSREFPIELPELEKGSYMVWATRFDGTFSPYPVYIAHGEAKQLALEVPETIPEGMAFVPGGGFFCGGAESTIYRWHKANLHSFFIRQKEVTVGEYLAFWKDLYDPALKEAFMSRIRLSEAEDSPIDAWDAEGKLSDNRLSMDYPVVGITEDAARAYCTWLGGKTGMTVRLPTADEWEKAARGVDGRTYPWGYDYDAAANLALTLDNSRGKNTYPLWAPPGSFKRDVSVYNVYDMGGNVREMTASTMPGQKDVFQIKGGSAFTPASYLPCAHVSVSPAIPSDIGFRYVMDIPKEEQ